MTEIELYEILMHYEKNGLKNTIDMYNYKENSFNEIKNDYMVITIKSNIWGDSKILIDIKDYEKIKQYKWTISRIGSKNQDIRLYASAWIKGRRIYLHRFIMNEPKNKIIDHANNNTFDNRKSNLRICNHTENSRNKLKTKFYTKSKYKNIWFDKKRRKFLSYITLKGKKIHLGYYEKDYDAALVYNGAAKYLFGEFANLNKI